MPLPFDATLKSIVAGHPGDFVSVFGLPTTEPVIAVNVDLSTVSAATDVALAYDNPVQTIVDLNFDLASIYRGVGLMSESTAFDDAIEVGEHRGEIKRSHHNLLLLGGQQLGAPDTETEAELKSIHDLNRLERLLQAILKVKSWPELLATP